MTRARSVRGPVFLVLAAAVHASLLLSVRSRPGEPRGPLEDVTIIDTEVTPETPAPEAPAQAARAAEIAKVERIPRSDLRAASTGREADRVHEPSEEPSPANPASPAGEPQARDGSEGSGWSLQPESSAVLTSPGAVARAVRTLERDSPSGEPGGVSTTGGLAEALDAHDSSIGMGRGGPVLTALENAAAAEDAPFEGAATFDVAIHTDGHVSVALLDAASGTEEWTRVGEATRRAFDPKRVRIPPGTRGWHVVVRLEAKVQFPNGLDPKKLGTKVTAAPTGVSLASAGKVCSVRLTLGLTLIPITGGCDESNIGARPLRVVHGHVVNEGRL